MGTASQTHCKRGHEFTVENVIQGVGRRTCRTCKEAADKEYFKAHRSELHEYRVNYHKTVSVKKHLEEKGWTEFMFTSQLLEQEGKCAICDITLTRGVKGSTTTACADHEHIIPPKPRGVLCPACNVGLGNFKDNIKT